MGAAYAAFGGGERLSKAKVRGISLGGQQIKIGPSQNLQLMYILLDRILIFYSHVINWAHGRRDYGSLQFPGRDKNAKKGFTANWGHKEKAAFGVFFKALHSVNSSKKDDLRERIKPILRSKLEEISNTENVYDAIQ